MTASGGGPTRHRTLRRRGRSRAQLVAAADSHDHIDRGRIRFPAEPLHEGAVASQNRREQFDRHRAVVGRGVIRAPHLAHAAAAQQLDQAITPERRPVYGLTVSTEHLRRGQTGKQLSKRCDVASPAATTGRPGAVQDNKMTAAMVATL
jgi:hypothetical protein